MNLPPNYDLAAEMLYQEGRNDALRGQPRTGVVGPSVIGLYTGVQAADDSNADNRARYGSVLNHWFRGWDDASQGWKDYGYKQSMSSGYYTDPLPSGGTLDSDRRRWLRWLYIQGYSAAKSGNPLPSGETYAKPDLQISAAQAAFEMQEGLQAGRKGNANPINGYVEPPSDSPQRVEQNQQSAAGDSWLSLLLLGKILGRQKKTRKRK